MYRGDYLSAYAGESVLLRYDPRDISTVFVYRQDSGKEVLLSQAHAIDLETEQISWEEAKAASRKIRNAGKQLSNKSILAEVQDRDTFIKQKKKSHKERKKEEQAQVHSLKPSQTKEPVETVEERPQPQKRLTEYLTTSNFAKTTMINLIEVSVLSIVERILKI